jgi:hypothetical protein
MDIRERNRLANQYSKEPEAKGIGSPFRRKLYIDARIKGKSKEAALKVAKISPNHEDNNMFCPDCGKRTLRIIEMIDPQGELATEYKEICTCDDCENMIHIYRPIL